MRDFGEYFILSLRAVVRPLVSESVVSVQVPGVLLERITDDNHLQAMLCSS